MHLPRLHVRLVGPDPARARAPPVSRVCWMGVPVTGALIWLVPVGRPQLQQDTELILARMAVPHAVVRTPELTEEVKAASGAIVHGSQVDTALLDTLRWLTSRRVTTLVLAERLTDAEEAHLLAHGAQDVVALPASTQRLDGRIGAMLRQLARMDEPPIGDTLITRGALSIDIDRRKVSLGGLPVALTKTEFELLTALAREPQQVLSHQHLMTEGTTRQLGLRALESHLSRTRRKLLAKGGIRLIEPVRGKGYRLGHVPATVASRDAATDVSLQQMGQSAPAQ